MQRVQNAEAKAKSATPKLLLPVTERALPRRTSRSRSTNLHRTPIRFGSYIWVAIIIAASQPSAAAQVAAETSRTRTAPTQPTSVPRESLAGEYKCNQMEIAARLLLQPSGHFKYELAYGPLDETAEGTWDVQGSAVFLTTVPGFKSPHFSVAGDQLNPYGILSITGGPMMKGAPLRVYLIYGPNEPGEMVEVDADGDVPLPGNRLPTAFIPVIPGYPIILKPILLKGPRIIGTIGNPATTGHNITLGFDPSGGKADFRLAAGDGVLIMTRPELQLMLDFKRDTSHFLE
jgi:hypothetical protein